MNAIVDWMTSYANRLVEAGLLPHMFSYAFMVKAFIAAVLAGPLLGLMGSLVVTKDMAFYSEALGHAAITGVGIAVLLGEPVESPYITLIGFLFIVALLTLYTRRHTRLSSDTVIGVVMALSVGLGASMLVAVVSRVNVNAIESVLFGSIIAVTALDIALILISGIIVGAFLYYTMPSLVLASMNPSLAKSRGINVAAYDYLFILLLTLVTVACLKSLGALLVVALLVVPAATAKNLSGSLRSYTMWSVVLATASTILGLVIPYSLDLPLPSGGTIALTAGILFLVSVPVRKLMRAD